MFEIDVDNFKLLQERAFLKQGIAVPHIFKLEEHSPESS